MTRGYLLLGLMAVAACDRGATRGKPAPTDAGTRRADAGHVGVAGHAGSADAGPRSTRIECDDGGACVTPQPASHIVERGRCDLPRAMPEPGTNPSPKSECHAHEDCAAGSNGRCSGANSSILRCSYDECFVDADCANGAHCVCGSVIELRLDGGFEQARDNENRCVSGDCAIDRACGDAAYCSHSDGPIFCNPSGRSYASGDYCHTSRDACIDDSDCKVHSVCAFAPDTRRWECFEDCVE